jgi:UDPglucose 6-dehydrogenase
MNSQEKIVIVGYGWVGQANALAFVTMGYDVSYFDPSDVPQHYVAEYKTLYEKVKRLSSVTEVDSENTTYVICVGDKVSEEGVQDISLIESVLKSLENVKGTVVLRATIVPDTLERLTFDYYVPEFLHEKTAVVECIIPYFVVVGKKAGTKKIEPSFLAVWRKSTPRQFEGTPREASFVKYLSNLWNSTRIAFVNEFGDAIVNPDSPDAVASIHRVINFVLEGEIYLKYGRAFTGHCLPKDTRAFSYWYKNNGSGTELLQGVLKSNNAHAVLEENCKDIPEWFSAWPTPHMSGFVALRELGYSIKKNLFDPREFIGRYFTTKVGLKIIVGILIVWGLLFLVR